MKENHRNSSYVSAEFSDKIKAEFFELTNQTVDSEFFYKSPEKEYINGNVANNLHLTMYYGLDDDLKNSQSFQELLDSIDLKKIYLGDIFLQRGFQGLYKILMIEVIDEDEQLYKIAEQISEYDPRYTKKFLRTFMPHLTLCYVENNFDINSIKNIFPEEVAVDKIIFVE